MATAGARGDGASGMDSVVPKASIASTDEARQFIERHKIASSGVGYVDVHLAASCLIDSSALWTRDRRLRAVADRPGVAADLD